ncbi:DoxX family protein [Natrinema sp. 1APR25-10V2]|uniref:DoxX family protein n=1 Tax=Natrinema sp. 1APR25-10V2 TaxID=2951081 RepID=UPI00287522A4|nr:DoxX family protein [Natrinema sp. 1APR25-10V2]MDS0477087.1 DoxX family protein [Natrinema sp. 1APR25-10V2]
MNLPTVAILGSQAVLGLVGLGVGGAKVTNQEDQVEDFQRFGYPQWFRIVTRVVEIGAGAGLIAGLLWLPGLTLAGGLLLSGVMVGAVVTHLRTGDPPSKAAAPATLFVFTAGLLAIRYLSIPL